jgi:hypothetical protein
VAWVLRRLVHWLRRHRYTAMAERIRALEIELGMAAASRDELREAWRIRLQLAHGVPRDAIHPWSGPVCPTCGDPIGAIFPRCWRSSCRAAADAAKEADKEQR